MTCGGRISGNSASGRPDIAINPPITVTIAITIATIGRLIKKLEIMNVLLSSLVSGAPLECGGLTPLWSRSSLFDNKAPSGRRTPRRRSISPSLGRCSHVRLRLDDHSGSDFDGAFGNDDVTRCKTFLDHPHRVGAFADFHRTKADLVVCADNSDLIRA